MVKQLTINVCLNGPKDCPCSILSFKISMNALNLILATLWRTASIHLVLMNVSVKEVIQEMVPAVKVSLQKRFYNGLPVNTPSP